MPQAQSAFVEIEEFITPDEYLHRDKKRETDAQQARAVSFDAKTEIQTGNNIETLGWTHTEALETHFRLRAFTEDWNYPGMEAYDDM